MRDAGIWLAVFCLKTGPLVHRTSNSRFVPLNLVFAELHLVSFFQFRMIMTEF